ncbi:MAG: hypothetical protein O3B38_04525 [Chloroflexi bacterium]|nr:hypothetical protein [Chloroflexota bacterium]
MHPPALACSQWRCGLGWRAGSAGGCQLGAPIAKHHAILRPGADPVKRPEAPRIKLRRCDPVNHHRLAVNCCDRELNRAGLFDFFQYTIVKCNRWRCSQKMPVMRIPVKHASQYNANAPAAEKNRLSIFAHHSCSYSLPLHALEQHAHRSQYARAKQKKAAGE